MTTKTAAPPKTFWAIGLLALLWNALGIVTYLMSVSMSTETLAAMSDAERALYTDIPVWVTSAYAIAVFAGTIACVALLLRKAWATVLFWISLLGIVVQMGHAFFMTAFLEVRGVGSAVLPILIIGVAVFLVWYAGKARDRGWLR